MSKYGKMLNQPSDVNSPAIGREADMVQNNAGGFTFSVSPEQRLTRFLILGADSSTYYASKEGHFRKAYTGALSSITSLGVKAVELIRDVSVSGRAPKQDATIFCLALCVAKGTPEVRALALKYLKDICRIPTHLFSFLSDYKNLGGKTGGRAIHRALSDWYTSQKPGSLSYQLVKYRQRGGWQHRDVLRLCKPSGYTTGEDTEAGRIGDVLAFAAGKEIKGKGEHLDLVTAYLAIKDLYYPEDPVEVQNVVNAIQEFGLPREAIPDVFLRSAEVWKALLLPSRGNKGGMPLTALIRNLNRMTVAGLFGYNSECTAYVIGRLGDAEAIKKARVHPIQFLAAARTYSQGQGEKGSLVWEPNSQIVRALEEGFILSFDAVPRTNKRYYLGLDVSGSMGSGEIAGIPNLTPREGSAAMALLWAKTEPLCVIKGFTSSRGWGSTSLTDLTEVFANNNLTNCVRKVQGLNFGATEPSLIIEDALKNKIPVDVFVVFTDCEVNCGTHPFEALKKYRKTLNINAKLVVIGMTATEFTLADPSDPGMLDVAGFDTAAPSIIAEFAKS